MSDLAAALAPVKACIPDQAKDLRLNLGSVIERSPLSAEEAAGAALAAAIMARSVDLVEAFSAVDELSAAQVAGAQTAAALMAMNTTWYPFVELADDLELEHAPAGLRMQAFATPRRGRPGALRALLPGRGGRREVPHVHRRPRRRAAQGRPLDRRDRLGRPHRRHRQRRGHRARHDGRHRLTRPPDAGPRVRIDWSHHGDRIGTGAVRARAGPRSR